MNVQSVVAFADGEPAPAVIDEAHLGRMTLGDASLEREVLAIFARQIALMLTRIESAEPAASGAAAHTLKGSARSIGAWRLAQAVERLEEARSDRPRGESVSAAIEALKVACEEACAAIGARLGDGGARHRAQG